MSLRAKITLILSSVVGVYFLADTVIQRRFGRQFEELQDDVALDDLERVANTLEREESRLAIRARDWAGRRAVIDAALRGDFDGLDRLVAASPLRAHDLDVLFVYRPTSADDTESLPPWGHIEAPGTAEPVGSLRELPRDRLAATHALRKRGADRSPVSGLLMTELGVLAVASHPVTAGTADDPGPGGIVLLGRFLEQGLFDEVGEQLQVAFHVSSVFAPDLPLAEEGLLDAITTAPGPVYRNAPDGKLHVYSTLPDLLGFPTVLLRTEIDPRIAAGGERAVKNALVSTLATGALILLVLLRVLSKTVIGPVAQLTSVAVRIGQTDDTTARTDIRRSDEIGQLSAEFDRMLEKLELSRQEVIRTARMAGMSEIATGVLHNVGNVLNSVNVSTNLVTRRTEELPVRDLVAMCEILDANRDDLARFVAEDPRGAHLVPFVEEVTRALQDQKGSILEELGSLQSGVEHIGELVRSQQSLTGRHGVLEPTDLAKQLDAAVVICRQAGVPSGKLHVEREYDELPGMEVDRHKLMEVVVNLVKNAIDAMAGCDERCLTLRLRRPDEGHVRIEVADTGAGIAEDDLTRIFAHGFTTKDDGHGFGLHVSANSATEMGGSLHAQSDGPGRGATFVLELPARPVEVAVAA